MNGAAIRYLLLIVVIGLLVTWIAPRYVAQSQDDSIATCLTNLDPIQQGTTGVFVEPDDSYEPLVDEIDAAKCDINVSIYLLSDQVVLDALAAAQDRGVRVRVQVEKDPFGGGWSAADDTTAWMTDREIEWKWTPASFQFSHAKYIVIDRQVALVMNQNLTDSAFNQNREFGVITTDPQTVEESLHVFESDWDNTALPSKLDRVVTSPENSRDTLVGLIDGSTSTIDFYAEVIRDELFIAALIDAERRGVNVRLIVNESSDPADQETYIQLASGGVDIRFSSSLYIHSKAMILDNRSTFIGSQNPTSNSFDNNREMGLRLDDPKVLDRMCAIFANDWAKSIPASPKRASSHDIAY